MNERDGRLGQFFGCYFNQDWVIEGAQSWRDVITYYARNEHPALVRQARDDLQSWWEDSANNVNENLPPAFGCDYDARSEGFTERQWVSRIVAEFDRLLQS